MNLAGGVMMTQKAAYTEAFKQICLPKLPNYSDPETFAIRIKKCTVLKYDEVSYSDTSSSNHQESQARRTAASLQIPTGAYR